MYARDDVVRRHPGFRQRIKPEFFVGFGEQKCTFQCVFGDLRREEQPLIKTRITAFVRAYFGAQRRRGKPLADELHKLFFARDIAARRRDASADIFDERSRDEVGAHRRGLRLLDKLAVAIVHQNQGVRAYFFDKRDHLADGGDAQRAAPLIAAAPTCEYRLYSAFFQRFFDAFVIKHGGKTVEFKVYHLKIHAEFFQRPAVFPRDDVRQSVVRLAGHRNQKVARAQDAEQHERERLCPRSDHGRNHGAFCAEGIREHLRQRISAGIVVAVTRTSRKMTRLNGIFPERVKHLFLIEKGVFGYVRELRSKLRDAFVDKVFGFFSFHRLSKYS